MSRTETSANAFATSAKVINFDAAGAFFEDLRRQGRKIVQSHGVFDLLHPGHIYHLEEARKLGDVLVVSVTADKFVQKGPGRPYFNEQLRVRSVTALDCVNYVVLIPASSAVTAIQTIRPRIYCKGKEYEDPDFDQSGLLVEETRAVKEIGAEMRFVGPVKFSSTKLLNLHFDHLSQPVKEFCNALASRYTRRSFHDAVMRLADLKVLVIGETIFDRYSCLRIQGLTSKNKVISGRFLEEETQCGGALAVFRHVKEFVNDVKFISLVGTEPWVEPLLAQHVAPHEDSIVRDESATTIIKQRFVEPLAEDKEMSKLFAVNFIDLEPPTPAVLEKLKTRIAEEIRQADAVLLLDFGHAMLQPHLRDLIQDSSKFLALNCQTNSANHGFNIISRQYRRADAFTVDEQEIMLSAGRRHLDFPAELESLRKQFKSRYAWLTRGPGQTVGLLDGCAPCLSPALETEVVDTVGAGDAFFSVAALAAARQFPIELATFLGQLAGAQAVKIVGNSRPISRQTLLHAGMTLLNF